MALEEYIKDEIVQDCADGLLTRRDALRRLGLMGVSVAAATTLLAACGGDDVATSTTTSSGAGSSTTAAGGTSPPTGGASTTAPGAGGTSEAITFTGPAGQLMGAFAPAPSPKGAVLVIHENRGLTPHFRSLTGRLATAGYTSLGIDLLSRSGGTDKVGDGAQAALGAAGMDDLQADLKAGLDELAKRAPGQKLGAIGFCFGGGVVWGMLQAGDPRLAAAIPFYGTPPTPADFSKSKAAVLAFYGENDTRVNSTRDAATRALQAASLTHEIKTMPGADHAFFNDTGPRYNAAAAQEANTLMLAWLDKHL